MIGWAIGGATYVVYERIVETVEIPTDQTNNGAPRGAQIERVGPVRNVEKIFHMAIGVVAQGTLLIGRPVRNKLVSL